MQTYFPAATRNSPDGRLADEIIRKCVHCGFCNVTCPSYQIVGNELDGPRGRIYLIKRALEEGRPGAALRDHLDTCLTCRNCETTCPAGVRYGELLEVGRRVAHQQVPRPARERVRRWAWRQVLTRRRLFTAAAAAGRLLRPLLPRRLSRPLPPVRAAGAWPAARHARRMLVLPGCVQGALDASIDAAAARVLDRQGGSLVPVTTSGCCGAIDLHLAQEEAAKRHMRRTIDACWPDIENGAEAIVSTASGCGVTLKDYGRLLADDPTHAAKAARFCALVKDLSEVVDPQGAGVSSGPATRVVFHSPCTLQHGQSLSGRTEAVLQAAGAEVVPVVEPHLCCGAAGTYAILQPEISDGLARRKLAHLDAAQGDVWLTANIGCQVHLQGHGERPVRHWINWLDERMAQAAHTGPTGPR